jgi:glycosyltransferase involved in cell wall biosynthesis
VGRPLAVSGVGVCLINSSHNRRQTGYTNPAVAQGLPPVYICLPTPTVGGAEKRLAGLWCHLQRAGHSEVTLVVQESLLQVLQSLPELGSLPEAVETFRVAFGADPRAPLRAKLSALHRARPDAIFHYVMVSPLQVQRFWSRRTLSTEPAASLSLYNTRGRLAAIASAALASRVDVLEAKVLSALAQRLPFKAGAFSQTPNSFVDLRHFAPKDSKANQLTFVGLFSEAKQAFRLAEAVPEIHRALTAAGVETPAFRFLGRETTTPGIKERLSAWPHIDAQAFFEVDPASVLANSKVVFSLQQITNYPSKALLEGLACGCLPVMTDVGETRQMVPAGVGAYVPRDFTAADVAEACVKLMTLSEPERRRQVELTRSHLATHFSVESMANYYLFLYRQLALL